MDAMELIPTLRRLWPAFAAVVSVAMLAAAHAFETFGGYAPCTLCLRQREVYWAALTVAVVGMALSALKRPLVREGLAICLAAIFLTGAVVAAYHAGAEWKWWPGPTTCSGAGGAVAAGAMSDLLSGAKVHPPACDQAAWRMLGVSMAGYNVLISTGLAALGFVAAFARDRK
jgi:disulfide bond formation protein DsbB